MPARRDQGVALNFDSLTDTITNLAGALILVVMLVLGMTRQTPPAATPGGPPAAPEVKKPKPLAPLLEEIQGLNLRIQQVDAEIHQLEQGLPALRDRVEQLKAKARQPKGVTT
jgi:hypothetical protein